MAVFRTGISLTAPPTISIIIAFKKAKVINIKKEMVAAITGNLLPPPRLLSSVDDTDQHAYEATDHDRDGLHKASYVVTADSPE